MNKREKEVQQVFLDSEKAVLKKLEENYKDALGEINSKIELLMARQDADMQHVIYQVEYQKALKTQVQAILENLQSNEFETVSEYLTQAYEDGYIGTMYNLQGQGIPLVMPIDQEQVVAAVQHETKLSESLYTTMGHDIKELNKKIAGEISRGISTGMMYAEIARNVASWARIPKNNAMRIARTEAHRIQCKASMDACNKAKDKGADVVKQWDAAMDKKTRKSHRELDGQIRELDEPFEINGHKAMHPGGFGVAKEDINCRCALLQRARWALGNDYTKWSEDAPVVIDDDGTTQFTIIEAKNYEEFQKKYKQASERVREGAQKMNAFVKAQTIEEAEQYARKFVVPDTGSKYSGKISYKGLDLEYANELNRTLTEIFGEYDIQPLSNIKPIPFREKRFKDTTATMAYEWTQGGTLYFNQNYFKSKKALQAHKEEAYSLLRTVINGADILLKSPNTSETKRMYIETLVKTGVQCISQGTDDYVRTTIHHELGHMLDDKIFRKTFKEKGFDVGKSMEDFANKVSGYATTTNAEYIAESFAAYKAGKTDILDPELVNIFRGVKNE